MKDVHQQEALARVIHNVTLHPPIHPAVGDGMDRIRDAARAFAEVIVDECPGSRELSMACTSLEDATQYAIASIARNQERFLDEQGVSTPRPD